MVENSVDRINKAIDDMSDSDNDATVNPQANPGSPTD
jgi:hypothetical protein